MNSRLVKQIAGAGALAIALSGCTSFLGHKGTSNGFSNVQVRAASSSEITDSDESFTEQGRSELKSGMVATAIVYFRQALAEGEPIAPAANGMGVAFAKLGRHDLAKEYFEQAIAADPEDSRYRANLARTERESLLIAVAETMKKAPATLSEAPDLSPRKSESLIRLSRGEVAIRTMPATASANRTESVAQANAMARNGHLERVSRGEVRIVTTPTGGTTRAFAKVGEKFKPLIRITFAKD